MTYKRALERAFLQTEKEAAIIWREVVAIYREAAADLWAKMADVFAKLKDAPPDKYFQELLKYNRYENLLKQMEKDFTAYVTKAGNLTAKSSELMLQNAYYRDQYIMTAFGNGAGIKTGFSALNPFLVDSAVKSTRASWQKIQSEAFTKKWGSPEGYKPKSGTLTEILLDNKQKAAVKIRRSISAGLTQGNPMMAKETVLKAIGSATVSPEKITANGLIHNALRIIRTEATRSYNAGAYAADSWFKQFDETSKRVWSATLDNRTRPEHAALDGQEENEDGYFEIDGMAALYPGDFGIPEMDINCRCTIKTVGGIPDETRIARDPETGRNQYIEGNFASWAADKGLKTNIYGMYYMPR
jgi:hypothetical protein